MIPFASVPGRDFVNRTGLSISALVIAFASLVATPAAAQQSLRAGLEKCATITNAAERLFCFDSLAADQDAPQPNSGAAASTTTRTSSSMSTPVASARPPMQPTSQPPTDATSGPASDNSSFGRELEQTREGPQSITSRYSGSFTGWSGDTEFELENGQVWRQVETGRLVFDAERPVITIRRGWFGAFYLKVEGANKQIRVKRVK